MNSNYETVEPCENEAVENFSWKYFCRQLVVCSVVWMNFFLYGLCIGGPTVYIPQIRREANSTDAVSEDMASWLSSTYGYGSLPWSIALPILAAYFGQKVPHILITINSFAAFIFFYLSSNVTEILISQIMESVIGASLSTISVSIITEFTSPEYRGIFLTFKSATFSWGIWIANAMGTYYHWKNIALLKLVLSIYPLIVVFFWPESPYWLASKGRLEKCAESHRWLKGRSIYYEKELEKIIESQKNMTIFWNFKSVFTKEFNRLLPLCFCVLGLYTFSGKITCGLYSLDIIKKMTSSESTAYTGMLLLDGLAVLGMYIGTLLSRYFRRRLLFIGATFLGIISLIALGVYTYLIHVSVLTENTYISLVLLSSYYMGIACGPIIFCNSLYAELLPLKLTSRFIAMSVVSIYDKILLGTVIKFSPLFIKSFGLHSAFFFFGIASSISLSILFKYMPETKDKTLVQIADEINGVDNSKPEIRQGQNKLISNPELNT